MKLDEYLWKNRIKKTHFAKKAKVTSRCIYDLISKVARVSDKTAQRICEATEGNVTKEELLEGCVWKRLEYWRKARDRDKGKPKLKQLDMFKGIKNAHQKN